MDKPHSLINMTEIISLLKKQTLFADYSDEAMHKFAKNFSEITHLPANKIIFHQGDVADGCYLLCEGKVEISIQTAQKKLRVLAELSEGSIFGETAILSNTYRNATVRTLTPCRLLFIKRELFLQLMIEDHLTSEEVMHLVHSRYRPLHEENISMHLRKLPDLTDIYILKNKSNGKYFQLFEEELFIWKLLDGDHTLKDILIEFTREYGEISYDEIADFILRLMSDDFIKASGLLQAHSKHRRTTSLSRGLNKLKSLMEFEIAFDNIDAFVTSFYKKIGWIFYTRVSQIVMGGIAIAGFLVFLYLFTEAPAALAGMKHPAKLLLYMIPVTLIDAFVHEFAHALTTKYYGREVHRMGVGWFWISAIAFADTSDMWLCDRKPRMVVNIAGIYSGIIIAGLVSMIALLVTNPVMMTFLWLYALLTYLTSFYNLDPIIESDGYYLLMDFFDRSNLRQKATVWLVDDSRNLFKNKENFKLYFPEIFYWFSCLAFIIISGFLAAILQIYVFSHIFPTEIHGFSLVSLQWILPLVVLFLSFYVLYTKVKTQG